MADPNTCEQCGVTNSNRTNITIRQSGKGKLVCQACYDIIHPEEKTIMENISKPEVEVAIHTFKIGDEYIKPGKYEEKPIVSDKLFYPNEQSLSSSKEKEEKGTIRSSSRRFPR